MDSSIKYFGFCPANFTHIVTVLFVLFSIESGIDTFEDENRFFTFKSNALHDWVGRGVTGPRHLGTLHVGYNTKKIAIMFKGSKFHTKNQVPNHIISALPYQNRIEPIGNWDKI
jgi:hypothetical protein